MLAFYSAIMKVLRLKRTCPQCDREFVLRPGDRKKQTIICPHCKKSIFIREPKKQKAET